MMFVGPFPREGGEGALYSHRGGRSPVARPIKCCVGATYNFRKVPHRYSKKRNCYSNWHGLCMALCAVRPSTTKLGSTPMRLNVKNAVLGSVLGVIAATALTLPAAADVIVTDVEFAVPPPIPVHITFPKNVTADA